MTVSVITIIHCDECKREGPEQTGKVAMINWTRMIAREYGWIIKIKQGKKIDVCPDCLKPDADAPDAASIKARWG